MNSIIKIGILTYHKSNNYGAYLQSQALCARLNMEQDIEAEIINFNMKCAERSYSISKKIKKWAKNPHQIKFDIDLRSTFSHLIDQSIGKISPKECISDSINTFQEFVRNKYDVIIAGSDEIWKLDGFRGFPNPYWLPGELGCRKFAYAASSRSIIDKLPDEKIRLLEDYLRDFEYIGVRDQMTYSEIIKHLDNADKVHMCCDPSFLYDFKAEGTDRVKKYLDKAKSVGNGKIILLMTADKKIADYVYKKYHSSFSLISVFHWNKGYQNIGALTPFEWLYLLKNVDFVVTTYFHATCFSIIYNTPFVSIGAKNKSEKLAELLNTPELAKRYISNFGDVIAEHGIFDRLMEHDDYSDFVQAKRSEFESLLTALRNAKR